MRQISGNGIKALTTVSPAGLQLASQSWSEVSTEMVRHVRKW